jgi:hypothetical protein
MKAPYVDLARINVANHLCNLFAAILCTGGTAIAAIGLVAWGTAVAIAGGIAWIIAGTVALCVARRQKR